MTPNDRFDTDAVVTREWREAYEIAGTWGILGNPCQNDPFRKGPELFVYSVKRK